MVTQRPSDVSRTILSQCNNFMILRLTNDQDQEVIRHLVSATLSSLTAVLPMLDVGESVVIGDAMLLPVRIRLDAPALKPASVTMPYWKMWSHKASSSEAIDSASRRCATSGAASPSERGGRAPRLLTREPPTRAGVVVVDLGHFDTDRRRDPDRLERRRHLLARVLLEVRHRLPDVGHVEAVAGLDDEVEEQPARDVRTSGSDAHGGDQRVVLTNRRARVLSAHYHSHRARSLENRCRSKYQSAHGLICCAHRNDESVRPRILIFVGRRLAGPSRVVQSSPSTFQGARVITETLAEEASGRRPAAPVRSAAGDDRLPLSYGTDTLVFTARDPTRAQAQWDISCARIRDAVGSLGGGRAILRLIGVPTGHLLAEHEVSAARGSYGVPLPEPDHAYAAELAIVRNYRKVILARSNVVEAPPNTPRAAAQPVFVTREQQRRALEHGGIAGVHAGDTPAQRPLPIGDATAAHTTGAGSEARLGARATGPGSGAGRGLGSEQRLARLG